MSAKNYCVSESAALKAYETTLVNSLRQCDVKRLCAEAIEIGVVPEDLRGIMDSLDSNVSTSIKIRYLLSHTYDPVKTDSGLCKQWLKVLAKYGVQKNIVDGVLTFLNSVQQSSCVSAQLAEGAHIAMTNCPRMADDIFLERHVSSLTEMFARISHKWEVLSIALNLPEHVRESIKLVMYTQDIKICLHKVFLEWIVGDHQGAVAPTVENLRKALHSETVGCGREADLLQEKVFIKHGIHFADEECSVSAKRPRISNDVCVEEGKSTLLYVEAADSECDRVVYYQWKKDGCEFEDSRKYVGVYSRFLRIVNSRVTSEGTYICEARTEDSQYIFNQQVVLEVKIHDLKRVLVDVYYSQPQLAQDSWPPVGSDIYINLALVKQNSEIGDYAYKTIRSSIDDVISDKESIKYEQVFTNLESGTRLLVEGRPGSGKTTLVRKFSRDWAEGNCDLNLQNIKLLFLIYLRGFLSDPNIKLRDILEKYYQSSESVEKILLHAQNNSGEGLCFVFDGLDEYCSEQRNTTFVYKVIKKESLPKSVVIIASRPAASAQLRKLVTKHIEVVGFLEKQIDDYVENYISLKPEKRSFLRECLSHPNIRSMCYLPIHIAMVCCIYDLSDNANALPVTETQVYTLFTIQTLLRALGKCVYLKSLDDLPEKETEVFSKICKLAFEKILSSEQVIQQSEIVVPNNINIDRYLLGLITVDSVATVYGFKNLYTFSHLTFQEYLAAYHVSKLVEHEQVELIRQHGSKDHMNIVWKFYCGLMDFTGGEDKFKTLLQPSRELHNIQFAYESQQSAMCDLVVENGAIDVMQYFGVEFENVPRQGTPYLTPSDFEALSYVLSNTRKPVWRLSFYYCMIVHEEIRWRCQRPIFCFTEFRITSNYIGDKGAKLLVTCFSEALNVLKLNRNTLQAYGFTTLAGGIQYCTNLHTLKLFFNGKIGDDGAMVLAESLKHCKNLRILYLVSNKIGVSGARYLASSFKYYNLKKLIFYEEDDCVVSLADGLQYCFSLQELNLSHNKTSLKSAMALAEGIKHCSNLNMLNLWNTSISCEALAEGIKYCSNLKELNLRGSEDGAMALANSLKLCVNLQELTLCENKGISPDVTKSLANNLKCCFNLKRLDLKCCSVGDEGAQALSDCIKHIPLQELDLSGSNKISDVGASALAGSLKHSNLQILWLSSNKIGDDGAKEIANNLKHCESLKKLYLCRCEIGVVGGKAILEEFNSLEELYLQGNEINFDGIKLSCCHCRNIQILNLVYNRIGDSGAKSLVEGLKFYSRLRMLDLAYNRIADDGAKAIARGLKFWNNLQIVNLGSNLIGDSGAIALVEGLEHCTGLLHLYLNKNQIGDEGAKALASLLEHCIKLKDLHLHDNIFGVVGAKSLADGQKHCKSLEKLYIWNNVIESDNAVMALASDIIDTKSSCCSQKCIRC